MTAVLISSVSKKVPLIKAVRNAIAKMKMPIEIIGADRDPLCIGRHFVDQFWQMPALEQLSLDDLISYCKEKKINYLIPTRDGELPFYAGHRESLLEKGVHVMISSLKAIDSCLDKVLFYQTISGANAPAIPTAQSLDVLGGGSRFVVKEQFGAGSCKIGLNLKRQEALNHAKQLDNPIFQPFIEGDEISVDLYLSRAAKTKGVVLRRRERVVAGESQVTSTFQDPAIEQLFAGIAEAMKLQGHVMFQAIISDKGPQIIECNPRFGGASTLSLAVGLDSFYWFLLEGLEKDIAQLPYQRLPEEKRLVRYPEDLIISCRTNV